MNKCFVTKLPVSSDNDELQKLGEIRLTFSPSNNSNSNLSIKGNVAGKILILKNAKLYNYNRTELLSDGANFSLPYGGDFTVVGNGIEPCEVRFFDKYVITDLSTEYIDLSKNWVGMVSSSLAITKSNITAADLSNFNTSLKKLSINYEGNFADFAKFKSLTELYIRNNSKNGIVVGKLSDIASITTLKNLNIWSVTGITGSIEDFVNANRDSGRTECSDFNFHSSPNIIKFNNGLLNNVDHVITWDSTTITVDGVQITA